MNFLKNLSLVLLLLTLPTYTVWAGEMEGLRNQRYCEILTSNDEWFTRNIKVYNTIGLNNCPAELWEKITPAQIKEQTKASYVRLNGPRFWTIDGIKNSTLVSKKTFKFGGIEMREAGVLRLDFTDIVKGRASYTKHTVKRHTTWVYKASKPIFELINSKGETFVMQSYSIEKVSQDEASLATLGTRLKLPKNWKFRTRTLENDAFLTPVKEKATVLQDDFLNTYQLETPDFAVSK